MVFLEEMDGDYPSVAVVACPCLSKVLVWHIAVFFIIVYVCVCNIFVHIYVTRERKLHYSPLCPQAELRKKHLLSH